ncbi:ricin-type beta-trefoil lectin domain protein [Dactylosporangium sp. NPDC000521]|uniref:ricin-type beta-trefoil lectin domain protein n=1 Tax=Dactylosporangium sp. NPDC000521 TaxID=3363975 RepID=UPI0036CE2B0D
MPRARRGLSIVITAATATAGAGFAVLAPPVAPANAAPAAPQRVVRPVEDAAARARATGRPVEVASSTSATQQTFANPDGTFTTNLNARPVRTKRDGAWVGLDASLRRNADGSYSPAAAAAPLVISGGGSGAFATMRGDGGQLGLKWPGNLPAPAVSGPTATYAGVLPGVDLAVTATEQGGFSHVLVIHDATAAANPALKALRLETVASGVTVEAGKDGDLTAVDRNGRPAFTAPAPVAWDSATPATKAGLRSAAPEPPFLNGEPTRSTVRGPGAVARQHRVGVSVAGDAVVITPDPAMLKDPSITYPLYVDPSWNPSPAAASRNAWTYVNSNYSTTKYWNSSDWARAGYAGWETPYYKARSFFQFGIPTNIWGTNITKATLQLKSVWSATNNVYSFGIYHTCGISNQTSWSAQPCQGNLVASANLPGNWRSDGSTNPMQHDFDVKSEIVAAAAGHWSTATLGLYNSTETNRDAWRKFENNPTIAIQYNAVPNTPANYGTSPSVPCGGGGQIGNTAVTFSATVSDPDGAQGLLDAGFTIADSTAGTTVATPVVTVSNNQTASVTLPASSFTHGHVYSWNVRASDGHDLGPVSPTCWFSVNKNTPVAPVVTSATFPANGTGAAVGTAGTFTFTPPAGTDPPISYIYSFTVEPPAVIPGSYGPFRGGTLLPAAGGTAPTSVSLTPRRFGPNVLYVYAINGAGNASPVTAYRFTTDAPAQPAAFGDFTGDGKPDVISVGTTSRPGAWLYSGTDNAGHLGAPVQAGGLGTGGAGSVGTVADWTGSSVGALDLTGDGAQDLLVRLPRSDADGNVEVIPAYGDGAVFAPAERIKLLLPRIDGGQGNQVVDQIAASVLPSITGSPLPDLYAIVGDALYVYPPGFPPGAFESPILLSTDWTGKTITAALNGTEPALFVRTDATGKVDLVTGDTGNGVYAGATGSTTATYSATGFPAATYPVVTGADINRDGRPDLWSDVRRAAINANLNTGSGAFAAPVANTAGSTGLLHSGLAGKCLDNSFGNSANTNKLTSYACNLGANTQLWTVPGDGTLRILGKCADVSSYGTTNGSQVWLYDCNLTANQIWQPGPNNSLVNPVSGRCLDTSLTAPDAVMQLWDCNGGANQSWTLDGTGIGIVRSGYAGKCLDNAGGAATNGNAVQIFDCHGAPLPQVWKLFPDGMLRNATSMCLDISGYGTTNGSKVWLYTCNGTANQIWQLGPNNTLINPVSGRCLDLPNGNTANGTALQIWDCAGNTAQQWVLPQ